MRGLGRFVVVVAALVAALWSAPASAQNDPGFNRYVSRSYGFMSGPLRLKSAANGSEPVTCTSANAGDVLYSSTSGLLRFCDGSAWGNVVASASGITGALTSGRVPYASGATTLTDASGFSFASSVLTVPNLLDSGLTASRLVASDASKNLVSTIASADMASSISDETGSGLAVFGTSPDITTSLTTGSSSFALVNANATTVNFAGAATTLNMGAAAATVGLGSGAALSWNSGDVTLTHSANALAFAGASSGYTFDALVAPAANDGAALGSASLSWSDLYLASGGVLNFANGNLTATHSSGVLSLNGSGGARVDIIGVLSSGFHAAVSIGTWDVFGYVQGTNRLAFGGFRSSQWDSVGLYANGSETIRLTSSATTLSSSTVFDLGTTAGITASTTQTQGQGALTSSINEVSTCANPNDTVTLPAASAGRFVLVINNGASTLQVFPASGNNLGGGVDTATTIGTGSRKLFVAFDSTNYEPVL